MYELMEEAYSAVQGMPSGVEGDDGIYEAKAMPVVGAASAQRRWIDHEAVRIRIFARVRHCELTGQRVPGRTSEHHTAMHDPTRPSGQTADSDANLTTSRNSEYDRIAMADLVNRMKAYRFPNWVNYKTAYDRLQTKALRRRQRLPACSSCSSRSRS